MQLTQKIRIFPSEEQKDVLWHLSEKCRLIYNFALKERKEAFEERKEYISYIDHYFSTSICLSIYRLSFTSEIK